MYILYLTPRIFISQALSIKWPSFYVLYQGCNSLCPLNLLYVPAITQTWRKAYRKKHIKLIFNFHACRKLSNTESAVESSGTPSYSTRPMCHTHTCESSSIMRLCKYFSSTFTNSLIFRIIKSKAQIFKFDLNLLLI